MRSRYGLIVRLLGAALLILALSPLTAPFSTCDPTDLFGGAPAAVSVSAQVKTAEDDLALGLGASDLAAPLLALPVVPKPAVAERAAGAVPVDLPLRL